MALRIKNIRDPAGPADGFRLLVMRRWPRGVRKTAISAWEKELGPSDELLDAYNRKQVPWPEYRKRYHAEMRAKSDLLRAWAERAERETVTILCWCKDERFCHRSLLREILERRLFRVRAALSGAASRSGPRAPARASPPAPRAAPGSPSGRRGRRRPPAPRRR
ncbi:MAG: DUF488 domain-containing protein [Thermoanaerobaculia bacterium]